MSEASERRKAALSEVKRAVIKVGSAVLTGDTGLDLRVVNRLADQIAALHDAGLDVILVSSGAVAAGRKAMIHCRDCDPREESLPAVQAVSAIGQSRLMHEYDEAFARYGKTTAQVLLAREDLQDRSRFLNVRNTLRKLLDWRVIPVVNENDPVAVAELKFGDNDFLASLMLSLTEADLFVNLTSAAGVFAENPDLVRTAKVLETIDNIAELPIEEMCQGKTSAGTGGMYSKLLAARRAAQLAVPTLIVSGREPYALERAFSGEAIGTWVDADEQSVSKRKFWLAYHSKPAGEIWVDEGAAEALTRRGKSLLAAGISRVEGSFEEGALVRILDWQGQTIGVGLANYSAADMRGVMGRKTDEIKKRLGRGAYTEAVHRDNMLLDPAL